MPWAMLSIDQALVAELPRWHITGATCLTLAEAARPPRVSRDGRTYEFRVRAEFTRFSTGERVTARNFEFAIERVADTRFGAPVYQGSPGRWLVRDVVRVDAPRPDRLVVRLRRPAHDLLARLSTPFFCAVHPSMATKPTYDAPVAAAGPYYIAEWDPAGDLTVLRRNPHYRGKRPRRAALIRFQAVGESAIAEIQAGRLDWYAARPAPELTRATRIRRRTSTAVRFLAFDTRPGKPFASVSLRRAVALALDRAALGTLRFPETPLRLGPPTDQMLTRPVPGRQEARIFPLRPNPGAIERARQLVAAERPGEMTLGIADRLGYGNQQAAAIRADLERVGFRIHIRLFPPVTSCPHAAAPDLTLVELRGQYADPATLFRYLAAPAPGCDTDLGPLLTEPWAQRFHASNRLQGKARLRALGRLEVRLLRDSIPVTALHEVEAIDVFSSRLGCIQGVEAGAFCLRR